MCTFMVYIYICIYVFLHTYTSKYLVYSVANRWELHIWPQQTGALLSLLRWLLISTELTHPYIYTCLFLCLFDWLFVCASLEPIYVPFLGGSFHLFHPPKMVFCNQNKGIPKRVPGIKNRHIFFHLDSTVYNTTAIVKEKLNVSSTTNHDFPCWSLPSIFKVSVDS